MAAPNTTLGEFLTDPALYTRCVVSLAVSVALYTVFGVFTSFFFERRLRMAKSGRPEVFAWSWDSDFVLGVSSLLAGTPIVQLFHHASDVYGPATGMSIYKDFFEYGAVWAIVQIPIYLLLWDLVFYILHRWVLHVGIFYKYSHANHHAFRPPVAWSGIAIDPFEVLMSGLAPYLVPLFLGIPFNEFMVYAVNALLMLHAEMLHSACPLQYPGLLGKILLSPIHHNMHHNYGKANASNFAPIFKIWDYLLGTMTDAEPYWWKADAEYRASRSARWLADIFKPATWAAMRDAVSPELRQTIATVAASEVAAEAAGRAAADGETPAAAAAPASSEPASLTPAASTDDGHDILQHFVLLPNVILRWFDIEYQARCYARLHGARPHLLHVVSFTTFITSFFAVTAALDSHTKNITLVCASLALCATMYSHPRFRNLVLAATVAFWAIGHFVVFAFGPDTIMACYMPVVLTSVIINIAGNLNADLFWQSPAGKNHMVLSVWMRLPFAMLQAFLAPFRLLPVLMWLTWFADVTALRHELKKPASQVSEPAMKQIPFAPLLQKLAKMGVPRSVLLSPSASALAECMSHGIAAAVQLWFIVDMGFLCHTRLAPLLVSCSL